MNRQEPDDSTYRGGFQQDDGYDMRLKRDDRRHQNGRGLDIHSEVVVVVVGSSLPNESEIRFFIFSWLILLFQAAL